MLKRTEKMLSKFDGLETPHDNAIAGLELTTKALEETIIKMNIKNSNEYGEWHKVYEKYFRMIKEIEKIKDLKQKNPQNNK